MFSFRAGQMKKNKINIIVDSIFFFKFNFINQKYNFTLKNYKYHLFDLFVGFI